MLNIGDMLRKEKRVQAKAKVENKKLPPPDRLKWFRDPRFYAVILINCSTRLVFNLVAAYMPFYMQMSTEVEKLYVALIPLIQGKWLSRNKNPITLEFLSRAKFY